MGDRDRQLGRLVVDVALTVVALGEQPVPDAAHRLPVVLGDQRDVTRTAPTVMKPNHLRVGEHELERIALSVGLPHQRRVQHLSEERQVRFLELANRDRHRAASCHSLSICARCSLPE